MPATKHCAYGLCRSDSRYSTREYMNGVTFVRFPKPHINMVLCERWVRACGRTGFTTKCVKKDTYICSKHFVNGGPSEDYPDPIPSTCTSSNEIRKFCRRRKAPLPRPTPVLHKMPKVSDAQLGNISQEEGATRPTMPLPRPITCGLEDTRPNTGDAAVPIFEEEVEITLETSSGDEDVDKPTLDDVAYSEQSSCSKDFSIQTDLINSPPTNDTAVQTELLQKGVGVQTEFVGSQMLSSRLEVIALKRENKSLRDEVDFLKAKNKSKLIRPVVKHTEPSSSNSKGNLKPAYQGFSIENIKHNVDMVKFYCGLTYLQLCTLWHFLGPAASKLIYYNRPLKEPERSPSKRSGPSRALTPFNELFLTLVRLRLGLLHKDLAYRFNISETQVSTIVITWVKFMYLKFKCLVPMMFPERSVLKKNLPTCFKNYKNTRCIIDCTEFYVQQSRHFGKQGNMYSSYKGRATYKVLVGICPNGSINYISDVFEGSISDRQIVIDSGFINILDEGDIVFADRGFNVVDKFLEKKVVLYKPPHLHQRPSLTPAEEAQTKIIAKLRIHVERAIERIKKFRLLQKTIPLSLEPVFNEMVFVCCCLVNFQEPIIN